MIFFPQKNRTHEIKTYGVGLVLGLLALITLPLIVQSNDYILALAWNILGVSGSISLGHAAFFGAGAYCSAVLSLEYGLSSWLTIPLAGLLATGLGLIMALICLRLRGAYFALATLAFVEIPRVITDNWDGLTHGSLGLVGVPGLPSLNLGTWSVDFSSSIMASYYFVFAYSLVLLGLVRFLFNSNLGLAFQAIREEEIAAEAVGIPANRYRLLSLLLSAYFTGVSGACYAHLVRYIEPGLQFVVDALQFSDLPWLH